MGGAASDPAPTRVAAPGFGWGAVARAEPDRSNLAGGMALSITPHTRRTAAMAKTNRGIEPEYPPDIRRAIRTTEFLVLIVGVLLVIVVGYTDDDLDVRTAWMIVGFLAGTYMLSRGIAKVGNRSDADT
ncbi:MAG TPA: hypothetical protein VK988_02605 [Acidimicrobiales bacterium]|nr:hypothetical protein [Acidimicrobiales bacterium]